jgi:hypothetical protein
MRCGSDGAGLAGLSARPVTERSGRSARIEHLPKIPSVALAPVWGNVWGSFKFSEPEAKRVSSFLLETLGITGRGGGIRTRDPLHPMLGSRPELYINQLVMAALATLQAERLITVYNRVA